MKMRVGKGKACKLFSTSEMRWKEWQYDRQILIKSAHLC